MNNNKKELNAVPDERGSFNIESHIKIFDPVTNVVIVSKR